MAFWLTDCACVSAGVGRVPAGAADHGAAPDEGLRAVFLGLHGSGQI